MAQPGSRSDPSETPPASVSVRNRVIAGLAVVIVAFTGLLIYSIVLHRQTTDRLALINSTYLPLTLGTSDVRATQLVFNTLMDRLTDDPNRSVTRDWIDAARRYRPIMLQRLEKVIGRVLAGELPEDEREFLEAVRKRLRQVSKRYRNNERKFAKLYEEMDAGHEEEAMIQIERLKRAERLLDKVLAGIEGELNSHITDVAEGAERDSVWATGALLGLTLVALLIGAAIVISVHRLLGPLKTLRAAVAKVAHGELGTQLKVSSNDEIGALTDGFNRMTAALAERDQLLIRSARLATAGKMAAQVTHEIRNPLSSLGLNADLLADELGDDARLEEARDLLVAMQDEIERLTGITESYLRFARLPQPELTRGDLNEAVKAAVSFMTTELEDRRIRTRTALGEDIPRLLFDNGQIRQALVNLLRNAKEAMPDGGEITVRTEVGDAEVRLSVQDTGVGIPKDAREAIFDSFFTTKSGGTGLGLAMVRQICLAHGGEVRYRDNDGAGSEFTVSLPLGDGNGNGDGGKDDRQKN